MAGEGEQTRFSLKRLVDTGGKSGRVTVPTTPPAATPPPAGAQVEWTPGSGIASTDAPQVYASVKVFDT